MIQSNNLGKVTPIANSFKMNIIIKMLQALRDSGRIKRTNLASKSGLNYGQCLKYVDVLCFLGWAHVIFDHEKHVLITDKGIEMIERLENLL